MATTATTAPGALGRRRRSTSLTQERRRRRGPLLPALIFTIVVTQLPFLVTLVYSFFSWNLLRPGSREFAFLENYGEVLGDSTTRKALLVTVLLTAGAVLASVLVGLACALLVDRKFLVDWASEFPLLTIIAVETWHWAPFMMLILLGGLQSQDRSVLEAARVDGATPLQSFRYLTLPHLRQFIELGVVLGSIYIVQTFDSIFMITQGGPGTATTNLPFELYQRAFRAFDVGEAAALGVIVVVLTIIVATYALRVISRLFTDPVVAARVLDISAFDRKREAEPARAGEVAA
jgi:sorbitol/mannitol transport system permease protein